jgi:PIN domain nuclease of toxin-antitoxin system
MNLLLDTHIFLWYISGDTKLPALARDTIRDLDNVVYLSVVSVWETIVKYQFRQAAFATPSGTVSGRTARAPRNRNLAA